MSSQAIFAYLVRQSLNRTNVGLKLKNNKLACQVKLCLNRTNVGLKLSMGASVHGHVS